MQLVKTKKTSLLSPFNSTDTSFTLVDFTDHKGNPLAMAAFDDFLVVTIRQGDTIEMVLCNNITQNTDGSATLAVVSTVGRDLPAIYPYVGTNIGEDFGSGAEVVSGDDPYTLYQISIAYTNSLVIAGAPNASITVKGIGEIATAAELTADAADGTGNTNAPLLATPSKLATSKYGLQLPSSDQKIFLNGATGMIVPYAGDTAPTGFLNCDGTAYSNDTYSALALVMKGKFGYNAGVSVTAATTDIFTAVSHGLVTGNIIFFSSTTTLPAGIAANTPYYVRDETGNTFKVAITNGGAAVDVTSTGTGTHYFYTQSRVPDFRARMPIGIGAGAFTLNFESTDVVTATDIITVPANTSLNNGTAVVLTTTGTLPTGLSLATTYYVIRLSSTTIKLASSIANALASTPIGIDLTAQGSGTNTITVTLSTRSIGEKGGEETHPLTISEMPSHTHDSYAYNGGSGISALNNQASNTSQTNTTAIQARGGNVPHNVMNPFVVVNYIVKT